MKPYWIKEVSTYNNKLTIWLHEELQYSNGIADYIIVANKKPFNELKKNDIINIDTAQIVNHSSDSWFSDSNIVSKSEY